VAAAAPEKTRAATNWRRSKGMSFPRETASAGYGLIPSLEIASQTLNLCIVNQTFYYSYFGNNDSLFDRKPENTNVFAISGRSRLGIRSSCNSGDSE
jgi:hypothetical protein